MDLRLRRQQGRRGGPRFTRRAYQPRKGRIGRAARSARHPAVELPTSSPSANPVGVIGGPSCRSRTHWNTAPVCFHACAVRWYSFLSLAVLVGGVIWLVGSRNPYTPAGYVGYLTRGAVFGKSIFYGIQRGPTSAGRAWLLDVTNVSVTPYTYTEDFTGEDAVLSKDNLKIAFRVHTVWRWTNHACRSSWNVSAQRCRIAVTTKNPTTSSRWRMRKLHS